MRPDICIGDSLALGAAGALGCASDAREGAGSAEILRRARASAPGRRRIVLSVGSNDPANPRLAANVAAIRDCADAGAAVAWIVPQLARPAAIVRAEAERRGDRAVAFRPGRDRVHPPSYGPLARDLAAAFAPTQEPPVATSTKLFDELAPRYIDKLIADFGMTDEDGAAVMGNAGHESGGFRRMQELKPVGGGRGGLGPFQWTGPRRRSYEAWLKRKGAKPGDFEADYAFLFRELTGPEKKAVPATKAAVGLQAKVIAFERAFERAGVKHYPSRLKWAKRALAVYRARGAAAPAPAPAAKPKPAPTAPAQQRPTTGWRYWLERLFGIGKAQAAPAPAPAETGDAAVRQIQERLAQLGYAEVGQIDGKYGTKTRGALGMFRDEQAPGLRIPAKLPLPDALIAAVNKGRERQVARERAEATVKDLREAGSTPVAGFDGFKNIGWLLSLFGLGGAVDKIGGVEKLQEIADQALSTFQAIQALVSGILTVVQLAFANWWLIALVLGVWIVLRAIRYMLEVVGLFRRNILGRANA